MESSGWKRAKRWVDLIAGLSVIATMGFVALQWYEMHSGGIDTHDLAVAAKAQADAAKSQADATKTIAESAKSQANNTEKLALASKSAADTAASALGETQREFRTGERPYLTPTPSGGFELPNGVHLVVHNDEKGNIKLSIEIVMTNSGKSPAIEVRATHSDYIIGPAKKMAQAASDYVPNYDASDFGSTVAANSSFVPTSENLTITQELLDAVNQGRWEVYVVGGVRYRDIFHPRIKPYETTYCFRVNTSGLPFAHINFGRGHFGNSIQ